MGFGGKGLQVRDILHVSDLFDLVWRQVGDLSGHAGRTYNVGGGRGISVSLRELTKECAARAGREVTIEPEPDTRDADVPYYITDNARVEKAAKWTPRRDVSSILEDVFEWLRESRTLVEPHFKTR
jgi:CDP-paratose 2-epimerase